MISHFVHGRMSIGGGLCAMVIALSASSGAAAPQESREIEHRIDATRAELREHMRAGEELARVGREEEAREHFHVAEQMEAELRELITWFEKVQAEENAARHHDNGHFRGAIEHLEHAMGILREHGNTELAMQLDRVANQMRERLQRAARMEEHPERRAARQQLEVLRTAWPALREAGHEEAAHQLGLAIRAREMGLEGLRGEEAREIRRQQPNREQLRRLLGQSIELYQEFGAHDQAERLAAAVRELWPQGDGERDRERAREGGGEVLELMRVAMHGLLEAEREDAAELLEHAIHARELRMEGARGEEARHVIETAPSHGQVVELLAFASRIWAEFGHETKAEQIGHLAEQMAREMQQRRDRDDRAEAERRDRERAMAAERDQHIRVLEERLAELMRAVEEIQHDLHRVRGEGGRIR